VENQLKAPSGSSVITTVTTLVTELVASGQTETEAVTNVKTDLGIDPSVDLLNLDPIKETTEGNELAEEVLAAVVKVQNLIVQISTVVEAEGGNSDASKAAVLENVAELIIANQGTVVDLTDPVVIEKVIEKTATDVGVTVAENVQDATATVAAAANTQVDDIIADNTSQGIGVLIEVAQVQQVAYVETTADLEKIVSGEKTAEEVIAENTGESLNDQVLSRRFKMFRETGMFREL
jgi:hypothetical protein